MFPMVLRSPAGRAPMPVLGTGPWGLPKALVPISASWLVIQWRTSNSSMRRLPSGKSNSNAQFSVLGVC